MPVENFKRVQSGAINYCERTSTRSLGALSHTMGEYDVTRIENISSIHRSVWRTFARNCEH